MVKGPGTVILIGRSVLAKELHVAHLHRMAALDRSHHARHRVGMAAAVQCGARIVDIYAIERRGEAIRVALAPHLAVGDDVEACPLLVADGDDRSVVLRLFEPLGGDAPEFLGTYAGWKALAEFFAIDQPVGLGVASHQRRWQQR
jgi:hypothetical protein